MVYLIPPGVRVSQALKQAERPWLSCPCKIVCEFIIRFTLGPVGRETRALMIAIKANKSINGRAAEFLSVFIPDNFGKTSILPKKHLAEEFATSTVIKISI